MGKWLDEAEKMMNSVSSGRMSDREGLDQELQTMILVSIARSLETIAAHLDSKDSSESDSEQ